jgi:hypothetical protein
MKNLLALSITLLLAACGGGGSTVVTNPASPSCQARAPTNIFVACKVGDAMPGCGSDELADEFAVECMATWKISGTTVWVYGVGTAAQARAYAAKRYSLPANAVAMEY